MSNQEGDMTTAQEYDALILKIEADVDKHGIAECLEALADLCLDKAAHVTDNWQDDARADRWGIIAHELHRLSERVKREGTL